MAMVAGSFIATTGIEGNFVEPFFSTRRGYLECFNLHALGFTAADTQSISPQLQLKRITPWRLADDGHFHARNETHLQQSLAEFVGADHRGHACPSTNRQIGK